MVSSEWNLLRLSTERRCVRHLIFLGAVQPADGIRLHLPSLERHGDLVLTFAELLLVGAAHERAFNVDVILCGAIIYVKQGRADFFCCGKRAIFLRIISLRLVFL